jgi:hypothetical protein
VKIELEHKCRMEEIKDTMECPKDFECHRSECKKLSNVEIIGDGKLLECLEAGHRECEYGLCFDFGTFCKCPLRNYIARNLGS